MYFEPKSIRNKEIISGFAYDPLLREQEKFEQSLLKEFKKFKTIFLLQKHTNSVAVYPGSSLKEPNDGIITQQKGVLLLLRTADCIPILFFDETTKTVGAIHAGWRGLADNIIKNGIEKAKKHYKINTNTTKVILGPSIGACCYKVSEDFKDNFKEYPEGLRGFGKHITFDLKAVAVKQLKELGIIKENIEIPEFCTSCHNQFYSYRRDKTSNRNISFIGRI